LNRVGGGLRTSCHAKGAAWQMSWRGRGVDYVCTRRSHISRGMMDIWGLRRRMAGDGCERKFQHALTVEVEARREKQLGAEVLALHVHDRRQAPVLSRHQRLEVFGGLGHSVAVPSGEYAP
jgi:hypothetical protein